ncbi:MAG: proteasome accessory factor PafA2 family protein [Candidatus Poribacteria bacterium]|nr:proteasome accessory factor PafA2 family protein [Candidatus Poribacteria bacterium]
MAEGISVYKNCSGTYGCHENYLMSSRVSDEQLSAQLVPFLVTRQIFAGSGQVKPTDQGMYALSQRAEHVREEITADTKVQGIINLRDDEVHADAKIYRRLHITSGDSNMSEFATYLKIGTTEIIVRLMEDDFLGQDLALRDSVAAIHQIAADTTCIRKIELANGKQLSAIEIQREYLASAKRYLDQTESDSTTDEIMRKWEDVLNRLEEDPMQLDREIDWVIKKKLIDTEVQNRGLAWDSKEVVGLDLQYHNIQPEVGLYHKLLKDGRVERIVTDEQINHAMHQPPENTRATFRGKYVKLANERKVLCGVNWNYIQLYEPYQKLFLLDNPFQSEFEAEDTVPEDFQQTLEAYRARQKT